MFEKAREQYIQMNGIAKEEGLGFMERRTQVAGS